MSRKLLLLMLVAAFAVPFVGCTSDDDDDTPPPPPPFGPSMIAVGDDGTILTSGDTLNWAKITVTGSLASLDLVKVVRVPNHASRRLVTFGRDTSVTTDPAEIWYSDNGGATWTEATVTVETTAGAHIAYWDIVDMMFVNQLDGYAVGNDDIILRTVDAGTTWTEMNTWSDPSLTTNPGDVEINLNVPTGTLPEVGTAVTQTHTVGTATGTVTAYDDSWDYITVTSVVGTFDTADDITWTGGSASVASVDDTDIWRFPTENVYGMYAVENSGTGTSRAHTIWFANWTGDDYEGIWKIDATAADPGGTRTFTWASPLSTYQATYSDIIDRFFFFDENTGVAATRNDGIYTTEDGGTTWALDTVSDVFGTEYWGEFWYSGGFLQGIENDGYLVRIGVTYSATATPPYQFDTTNSWDVLDQTGSYNSAEVDDHSGVVLWNNHIYAICIDSVGDWTYGDVINSATYDNDVYSDPDDINRGGVSSMGANPIYNKEIEVGSTTYFLNHWCQR